MAGGRAAPEEGFAFAFSFAVRQCQTRNFKGGEALESWITGGG